MQKTNKSYAPMRKSVVSLEYCYGCGVCSISCPVDLIEIELGQDGFYRPKLNNPDKCIGCAKCVKSCAFANDFLCIEQRVIGSYAVWSRNELTRQSCSSGGVCYELCKKLIEDGFEYCGVKYNVEKERCEHYIGKSIEELEPSKGSKYLQSYTVDALKHIDLNKHTVFIGTPCQVDSMRRFVRMNKKEENFFFIDFFCHGVPSYVIWQKYIDNVKKSFGRVLNVEWRNKDNGWHDSWAMKIVGEKGVFSSKLSNWDSFYTIFLSDTCLNKACYFNCKYKGEKSSADIRVGDLWSGLYSKNVQGVSAVLTFSENGERVLKETSCDLVSHPLSIVTEGQMLKSPSFNFYVRYVRNLINSEYHLNKIAGLCKLYIKYNNSMRLILNPRDTFIKIFRKIRIK